MAAAMGCVRFGGLEKILTSGITGRGEKIMSHKFVKTCLSLASWRKIAFLNEVSTIKRIKLSLLIIFINEKDLGNSNTYQIWCYMLQHRP